MKAIQVKYLPATDTGGSRFKAWIDGTSVTVPFNYATDEGDVDACYKLDKKLGWNYSYIKGTLPNGDSVFVIKP